LQEAARVAAELIQSRQTQHETLKIDTKHFRDRQAFWRNPPEWAQMQKEVCGATQIGGTGKTESPNVSAPNGVAIGRDNYGRVEVKNNFSDRYPRPGTTPRVSFCAYQSELVDNQYETRIKVETDTEITAPFWGLFFDGPVTDAKASIDDIKEPFGSSSGHPFPSGVKLDPIGTLPENSRLLIGSASNSSTVAPENVLRIQITEIGNPFGGPYRPWRPKDHLSLVVYSHQPVHLLAITSGYGTEFLQENMLIRCPQ
jgi:hypothetical protein